MNLSILLFSYQSALEMVAAGRVNIKPLITHRFPLKDSLSAFQASAVASDGAIKVMIKCAQDWTIARKSIKTSFI